jgi:hypothetical protein
MKKLLILGLALLAACAANAIPTLTGPTGGFELPTADVLGGGVTVSVDQNTSGNNDYVAGVYPSVNVLVGLGSGIEVGANYAKQWAYRYNSDSDSARIDSYDVNAKWQLPLGEKDFKVAVGALYGQMAQSDQYDGTVIGPQYNIYAAITAPIAGFKCTGNIGYGKNVDEYYYDNDSQGQTGFNGGVAVEKMLGEDTKAGAELIFGDKTGAFGSIAPWMTHANLYLTQKIGKGLSARAGIGGIGQYTDLFLGAAYTFGK